MEETTRAALARFTTLKVGGEAKRLFHPSSPEDLISLLDRLKTEGEPWFILGGGSNLLVSSDGFEGTVIRLTEMTQITSPEPGVLVAFAGTRLPHLARYAAASGLSGLEFSVGIPGTVGGASIMNAGAHGSCFANVVESVTVFDCEKWDLLTLNQSELGFAYRSSCLNPDKQIVVSARLRLNPACAETITALTRKHEEYRFATQPLGWPNAGSTFKNPAGDHGAGYLLDKSGAKELKEGNAAVSAIHANFVINLGGARSGEITRLLQRMQACVYKTFGVRLVPEWKRLGYFSPAELEIWSESV